MTKTLIRGAHVIAAPGKADPGAKLDILVEDALVSVVAPDLDPAGFEDAEIVDAAGRIVVPGLVNAHMHSWQSPFRGLSLDWNLMEYLIWAHGRIAPQMTPEDVYVGTLAAALGQINCGATALGDWCHANPTPAHGEAAVAALAESGIRALFLHSTRHGEAGQSRADIERLLGNSAFDGGLLTLGLAIAGPLYSPPEVAEADLALAREFGLVASMHHSSGPQCPSEVWLSLIEKDLMGPWVNLVHANTIDDNLLARLVDRGVTFTMTPEVELNDGHGHPITGRLRALGAVPALGIDIETGTSPELTIAARMALAHQRGLDFAAIQADNSLVERIGRIARIEALGWLTSAGAAALGLSDRIGALEPGLQADLAIIDPRAINLWPGNDPVTAVLHSSLANVEAVMVAGRWQKRAGKLAYSGIDALMDRVADVRTRVLEAADLPEIAFR